MLRSASKNFNDVAVVVDPADYAGIVKEMDGGGISAKTRFQLAAKAFTHTAAYDTMISSFFMRRRRGHRVPAVPQVTLKPARGKAYPEKVPAMFAARLGGQQVPHIQFAPANKGAGPALRGEPAPGRGVLPRGQLTEPSPPPASSRARRCRFNNYLDANSALEAAKEFDEPVSVIIKHNNPCGVATDPNLWEAYVKAREIDPVSAFGGVLAFNRPVDEETAREITSTFVEVVIAPGYDKKALALFKKKGNIRLLDIGPNMRGPRSGFDMKRVAV
jgi:phosphoribosylaminoimidazolecarboxamide formyltransferase/IMP cyclohydrolase